MTDLRTRLLSRFRVLSLLLEPNTAYSDFTVPAESLSLWLERYVQWYADQCTEKPFLFYGHSVSISGSELLICSDSLEKILACCARHQLPVTLQMDFPEVYENIDLLISLCEQYSVGALTLTITEIPSDISPEQIESFFCRLRTLRRLLTLTASLDTLQRYQLFSSPALNSSDLTVNLLEPQTASVPVKTPVFPCAERFSLCVDTDGLLYPCAGLMNLPDCAIGSVYSEEPLGLNDDLLELMVLGPDIPALGTVSPEPFLPWICRRHRAELIAHA